MCSASKKLKTVRKRFGKDLNLLSSPLFSTPSGLGTHERGNARDARSAARPRARPICAPWLTAAPTLCLPRTRLRDHERHERELPRQPPLAHDTVAAPARSTCAAARTLCAVILELAGNAATCPNGALAPAAPPLAVLTSHDRPRRFQDLARCNRGSEDARARERAETVRRVRGTRLSTCLAFWKRYGRRERTADHPCAWSHAASCADPCR